MLLTSEESALKFVSVKYSYSEGGCYDETAIILIEVYGVNCFFFGFAFHLWMKFICIIY